MSPSSSAGVGLGYGIAIAVGILVLISTIMLASYLCVRIKSTAPAGPTTSGHRINRVPSFSSSSSAPPPPALGLDGPTIESCCPKFPYARHVAPQQQQQQQRQKGRRGVVGPCAICLGDYEEGEMVRVVLECDHSFHARCVDEWLRMSATCPVCRSSPVPSPVATPVATPLSELIPLAAYPR